MDRKKYYITTAIAYTSGKPHIGNTYEAMTCSSRQEQTSTDRKSR